MEKVLETNLTPEDAYDVLDAGLTHILQLTGADLGDEEILSHLVSYNRQLRIALGLPVEVGM